MGTKGKPNVMGISKSAVTPSESVFKEEQANRPSYDSEELKRKNSEAVLQDESLILLTAQRKGIVKKEINYTN